MPKKSKSRNTSKSPVIHGCSNGCTCDGNLALYRTHNGHSVFTGMVCPPGGDMRTDAIRLDAAGGDLEGPGHAVGVDEWMAQMSFYSDSALPIKPVEPSGLLAPDEAAKVWPGDVAPTSIDDVRRDDTVRVACMDQLPSGQFARERFWVDVRAVIPFPPTIIGTVAEPLYWLPSPEAPLDDATLIKVPLDKVLGVEKGPLWDA